MIQTKMLIMLDKMV